MLIGTEFRSFSELRLIRLLDLSRNCLEEPSIDEFVGIDELLHVFDITDFNDSIISANFV